MAAAARDSSACHWRSSPNISSRDAPAHRHPGPDAASSATASAADGGQVSHSPPLAKPGKVSVAAGRAGGAVRQARVTARRAAVPVPVTRLLRHD